MKTRNKVYLKTIVSPQGLVTIGAAILAGLSLIEFIFSPADGVILSVLSILTASIMFDKLEKELFNKKLIALANNHKAATDALVHLDDLPPLATRLLGANEIWITGLTLSTFFVSHRILLGKFFKDGGNIRILMTPNDGSVVDEAFLYFPMERALYHSGMRISKDIIAELCTTYNDQIEVRTLSVFPSHLLLIINPKQNDGEAQIHLNVFQQSPESNPVLIVYREESETMYNIFISEFESLWKGDVIAERGES